MAAEDEPTAALAPPVLRVVKGVPTPEQLAALVAVIGAVGGGEAPATRRPSTWSAPRRRHREPLHHGAGGWRAGGLPR